MGKRLACNAALVVGLVLLSAAILAISSKAKGDSRSTCIYSQLASFKAYDIICTQRPD